MDWLVGILVVEAAEYTLGVPEAARGRVVEKSAEGIGPPFEEETVDRVAQMGAQ
jgi:hypothetical protein